MTTKYRFEQGAGMAACTLTSDDGGSAIVYCAIPGGRPRFTFRRDAREDIAVDGAPQCDTFKAFKAFVLARFADEVQS